LHNLGEIFLNEVFLVKLQKSTKYAYIYTTTLLESFLHSGDLSDDDLPACLPGRETAG
jgi:hypothetical protein